jgi:uncharacterized membrane protein YphA (DoxX/SURF4 family)
MNRLLDHRWIPWIGLVARLTIGIVWLIAGGLKAFNPYSAGAAVRAYEIFPVDLATTIGQILPWIEIGLGVLLILGVYTRTAAAFSAVLFLAFIAGIASAWARGLTIDCGCFGGGGFVEPGETKYLQEILRDIGLILLCGLLVLRPRTRLSLASR